MFIDSTEKEGERNIDWLPPVHTPAGGRIHNLVHWTHDLLVHGVTLQPTEPPGEGQSGVFTDWAAGLHFAIVKTSDQFVHPAVHIFWQESLCVSQQTKTKITVYLLQKIRIDEATNHLFFIIYCK